MHRDTFKQDNYSTVGGDGGCRVGEVRAGTTSPMPNHKGFQLQQLSRDPLRNFQKFSTLRVNVQMLFAELNNLWILVTYICHVFLYESVKFRWCTRSCKSYALFVWRNWDLNSQPSDPATSLSYRDRCFSPLCHPHHLDFFIPYNRDFCIYNWTKNTCF